MSSLIFDRLNRASFKVSSDFAKCSLIYEFTFSIDYSNYVEKAKAIVMAICSSHKMVLADPEPFVRVSRYAESSVDVVARVWVNSGDYWTVHFDILEAVKTAFDENNITIPFNQLDVHIKKDS